MRFLLLVLPGGLLLCGLQAAPGDKPEQRTFSAEESQVQKPVVLPQDVLATLGQDELVRMELENHGIFGESASGDLVFGVGDSSEHIQAAGYSRDGRGRARRG
jgi:hypothetical protein